MAKADAGQRADWVRLFQESNLTVGSFARRRGLRPSTLRRWLARFPTPSSSTPEFHQIVLPPMDRPPGSCAWDAELCLPEGRMLRLHGDLAREIALAALAAHRL